MGKERSAIQNAAQELMNQNYEQLGLGINVIAVQLQNVVPPKGVQDAFEDVNKAIVKSKQRLKYFLYIPYSIKIYKKLIPKCTKIHLGISLQQSHTY